MDAFSRARAVMPGGVSSPVRAFGAVGGDPVFIASGSGSRVTDVQGREYIDMLGSWGPLILGHTDPRVVDAINQAAARGTSFGAPAMAEVELAEKIVAALPSVEMVRFVSSGTEAAMSAVRLARATTGRAKILKFAGCYHGHADAFLVSAGSGSATLGLPDSPGVTEGSRADTVVAKFNSLESVTQAFERFGPELAAVIVEPVAANMGVVPPAPASGTSFGLKPLNTPEGAPEASSAEGFLRHLRHLCDDNQSLLIFDEVVTGFRVSYSGAQGMYGIDPDLTILGKIIGGGLPVGAYGGRRELMEMVAPSGQVYQAGTLSGNPVSMAAGLATIGALGPDDPYEQLEKMGTALQEGLEAAAHDAQVPVTINRVGSMLTVFFTDTAPTDFESAKRSDTSAFAQFFHGMLQEGVYWPPSQFEAAFLSRAHTDSDIEQVISAAARSFERIKI